MSRQFSGGMWVTVPRCVLLLVLVLEYVRHLARPKSQICNHSVHKNTIKTTVLQDPQLIVDDAVLLNCWWDKDGCTIAFSQCITDFNAYAGLLVLHCHTANATMNYILYANNSLTLTLSECLI